MSSPHPVFPSFSYEDAAALLPTEIANYGSEPDQLIELYGDSAQSDRTIVLIHGGYWRSIFDREHIRPLGVALAQAGFHIAIPEFRRVAGDPDLTVSDLATALSSLGNRPLLLIGYSSGGHLALILADQFPSVRKVIGLAPVTDLQESERLGLGRGAVLEWLGREAVARPELDPMEREPLSKPITFIQGTSDERVPIEITRDYIEKMASLGAKIEMVELDGITHFEMMDIPSPTYSAILEVLHS